MLVGYVWISIVPASGPLPAAADAMILSSPGYDVLG